MEPREALGSARSDMLQGGILEEVGTGRAALFCQQGVIRQRTESLCYRLLLERRIWNIASQGVCCLLIHFVSLSGVFRSSPPYSSSTRHSLAAFLYRLAIQMKRGSVWCVDWDPSTPRRLALGLSSCCPVSLLDVESMALLPVARVGL